MDIASRLKRFLEANKITNSQFADCCEIPRPTVTQLLNGRNKKVSDEVIRKIHASYPSLSIMWLMFGEEPMLTGPSISSAEIGPNRTIVKSSDSKPPENSFFTGDVDSYPENENVTGPTQDKKIVFSGDELVHAPQDESFTKPGPNSQGVVGKSSSGGYNYRPSNPKKDNLDMDSPGNAISQALERIAKSVDQQRAERQDQPKVQGGKRIVNVMVFYSDNSFESFTPER